MNIVFLEKLRIVQVVRNVSAFYKTEISLPFTQELSLFPTLSLIVFKTQLILDAYMRLGLFGGFPLQKPLSQLCILVYPTHLISLYSQY